MGPRTVAEDKVIPIDEGVKKSKRKRIALQVSKGPLGIEIRAQQVPDQSRPVPLYGPNSWRRDTNLQRAERKYWIDSDDRVGVLTAGAAKPKRAAFVFSSLDELTTLTRAWHMAHFVSVWNKLPGRGKVSRFENRAIAVGRLWRAMESLEDQPCRKGQRGSRRVRPKRNAS